MEADVPWDEILVVPLMYCQLGRINIWIRTDVCLGRYKGEYTCLRSHPEEGEPCFTLSFFFLYLTIA